MWGQRLGAEITVWASVLTLCSLVPLPLPLLVPLPLPLSLPLSLPCPCPLPLPDSQFPHLPLIMVQAGHCSRHPKLTAQRLWIQQTCSFLPTTGPKGVLQGGQDLLTTIISAIIGVFILWPLSTCDVLGSWPHLTLIIINEKGSFLFYRKSQKVDLWKNW